MCEREGENENTCRRGWESILECGENGGGLDDACGHGKWTAEALGMWCLSMGDGELMTGFIEHWVWPRCVGKILREVKGIGKSAAGLTDHAT